MRVDNRDYRTVWMKNGTVYMIDQNKLPFEFSTVELHYSHETSRAIKDMTIRGAGAIGATAGYAMAQAFLKAPAANQNFYIETEKERIEATRPTAQNLFYAVKRVYDAAKGARNPVSAALEESQEIADEDVMACRKIGEHGNSLIKDGFRILTHCNAGWLAFVDWGSALSPIYIAHRNGKKIFVYADETRPRGQGARLTAWELKNEGVPHVIIPDNAGAYYMSKGSVDMIIVGADRIARNGDVANKIGTLDRAVLAKRYGVPFYVAAPTSTFDLKCDSGDKIPIEQRSDDEVLYQTGLDESGVMRKIQVCSPNSHAYNPAFDVTPAELIAGLITEKGIINPTEKMIKELFS